eukprot:1107224-Rhodomonas_salina.1
MLLRAGSTTLGAEKTMLLCRGGGCQSACGAGAGCGSAPKVAESRPGQRADDPRRLSTPRLGHPTPPYTPDPRSWTLNPRPWTLSTRYCICQASWRLSLKTFFPLLYKSGCPSLGTKGHADFRTGNWYSLES